MNLKDAVYLLEFHGMSVSFSGSGSVIDIFDDKGDRIIIGQKLIRGSVIKLVLG